MDFDSEMQQHMSESSVFVFIRMDFDFEMEQHMSESSVMVCFMRDWLVLLCFYVHNYEDSVAAIQCC